MKIYLGTASWRALQSEHVQCLLKFLDRDVVYHPQVGDALVSRARSIVATRFLLNSDADVLLTIDDDIIFRPEDARKICEQALELTAIMVGVYFTRSADRCHPTSAFEVGVPVEFCGDPTPVPIRWGASGFMAIPRRIIEALSEGMRLTHADNPNWQHYPFYRTMDGDDGCGNLIELSEDYAFCQRTKDIGFGVYANPAVLLGHIGTKVYTLTDAVPHKVYRGPICMTRVGSVNYRVDFVDEEEVAGPHLVLARG